MMMEKGIRFRGVGNIGELPDSVVKVVRELEAQTASNTGMLLQLALSYSAREEITEACKAIARRVRAGELDPDPDLLIRTSGEIRLSNFLLWQVAYTELYVTDVLWPDFNREHLLEAIRSYQGRERRFGLTTEQVAG